MQDKKERKKERISKQERKESSIQDKKERKNTEELITWMSIKKEMEKKLK